MKKIAKLLIAILVITLFFELIAYIFKTSHEVEYKIKNNENEYIINEVYKNKQYYILVNNKDNRYSFEVKEKLHKKKKVVSEIIEYKLKDALCIYPVVNKSESTNIICSKDNKSYSYTYYKNSLKDFVKELKHKGYRNNSWNDANNYQTKVDTLKVYNKNITDDTYIYIYKYDGFYTINNEENNKLKLFKNDNYINTLGTQIDKYYIVPNYDQKYDYKEFYIINMTNNKVKSKVYKKEISKDSYINGVIDNEIYLFDKDELKQYKIYKKGKKIKEVGNKENGVLYYDLKFKTKDVYTFRDEEITFKTFKDYISEIEQNTSMKYIRNNIDTYYYQTSNNDVYYYNIHNKQKVLLFNQKISDFILLKDTIYFISSDTLYSYNINEGLKKLVTYSELQFNYKNRIAIYTE